MLISLLIAIVDGCVWNIVMVDRVANFSHNLISTLAVSGTPPTIQPLPVLDVSHNRISTIEDNVFKFFTRLDKLHLHHNKIRQAALSVVMWQN